VVAGWLQTVATVAGIISLDPALLNGYITSSCYGFREQVPLLMVTDIQ
jgi:hypothetical protein